MHLHFGSVRGSTKKKVILSILKAKLFCKEQKIKSIL